jgi:MFS family permease
VPHQAGAPGERLVIHSEAAADPEVRNHPKAVRMGIIAGMSFNIIIGSVFGTSAVLLKPMQERLHVSPEMSSAAVPLVMVGGAILASVAGVLAGRYSLRFLLALGASLLMSAWLILAFTASFPIYLLVYGLLLGPAMALGGQVLPPTLVTRWFNRNRGLAIGLVHLPIVVAIMPVAANWVITNYGLHATFLMLAALAGLVLLPASLLVIDHPPGEQTPAASAKAQLTTPDGALSVWQLLGNGRFWCFALALGAINTSSVTLTVHLVSMAESWGFDRSSGAALASVMSLVGMAGSIAFGLIADRLGGGKTLALILFDAGLLWALLLLGLPYSALLVVIGFIGMHGAGAIPAISKAISEVFGAASFSRAYGLAATLALPLMVLGVMGTGKVYGMNNSYVVAILAMISYLIVSVPIALFASRGRVVTVSAVTPA